MNALGTDLLFVSVSINFRIKHRAQLLKKEKI